jgi:hypothetical protein
MEITRTVFAIAVASLLTLAFGHVASRTDCAAHWRNFQ